MRQQDNKFFRQRTTDNGRGSSRNHGIMELRKLHQTTSQRDNETTSRAAATCSLVVSWTCSLKNSRLRPTVVRSP